MKVFKIAIVAVLAAIVLLLVFGVPANFLAARVKDRIAAETGYQVEVGGMTTVAFRPSPTIVFRDLTLSGGSSPDSGAAGPHDRFKVRTVSIALAFTELLRGRVHITQVTISHPELRLTLKREPTARVSAPAPSSATGEAKAPPVIDRVVVEDGAVSFYKAADRVQDSIDHINLVASRTSADGRPSVTGDFSWGGEPLHVDLQSQVLPGHLEGETIPVQLTLQAPDLPMQSVSVRAELRVRDRSLAVNSLSGTFGKSKFNGWVNVDFAAGKPLVKADLDFDRLQIRPAPAASAAPGRTDAPRQNVLNEPWSDREYNVDGLNFFDAQVRLSASELDLASFRLAPIAAVAALNNGVLQITLAQTGLYGGEANGTVSLDASAATPAYAMQMRIEGVNALPMLSDVAGFSSLEGTMSAKIDVNAKGRSERTAIESLAGNVDVALANGAVRGIDLAKLLHNLTGTILNGWQQDPSDKTPLTDFSAQFRLADGIATTDNIALNGPVVRMTGAGTVDIPAKTLQLKVDPQLVVGGQDANNASNATGLGVPVVIKGDWSAPRIYPDVAGILDDPNSVYNRLREAGKGLFGDTGHSGNNSTIDTILQGLGNMLNGNSGGGAGSGHNP